MGNYDEQIKNLSEIVYKFERLEKKSEEVKTND